jgi:polyisoprenoid-binding protein YceI
MSTTTWNLDPAHSTAEFKVRHMMISWVKGKFTGLSGALTLHESNHAYSGVEATINVATITTGADDRDNHLKSADFFDAAQFPTITFKSTTVEPKGKRELAVTGDLTIHGVTKPVTFTVEELSEPSKDPWGNQRIGIEAVAKINRKDFGLSWNAALETGGVLVGEDVTITLDVQFVKAAA